MPLLQPPSELERLGRHVGRERPLYCFLGKVHYLWRRRNAYWGNESRNYFSRPFGLNLKLLQRRSWIERGSQWLIEDLPAIVVASRQAAFVLALNGETSMVPDELKRLKRLSRNMERVVQELIAVTEFECEPFVARADVVEPAELPFFSYTPHVEGGRHVWSPSVSGESLQPALAAVAKITRLLQWR